jgi:hypothetical protein
VPPSPSRNAFVSWEWVRAGLTTTRNKGKRLGHPRDVPASIMPSNLRQVWTIPVTIRLRTNIRDSKTRITPACLR